MSWRSMAVMNITMAILMIGIMYGFMSYFPMKENMGTVLLPEVVERMNQEEVLQLLRKTFPEAQVRGSEKNHYSIVSISKTEEFLKNFLDMNLDFSEDSDCIIRFMGELKQPGWMEVPVGFTKSDSENSIRLITVSVDNGIIRIYMADITEKKFSAVTQDNSVKITVLF